MSKELQDSLRQLHEYAENLKSYINKQESNELDIDGLLSEYGVDLKKFEEDFMLDKSKISLPFVRLSPDAVSPKFNYETDSGFDLHSIVDIEIPALGRALVPTGLSFDIKDGFEIQVRSKSGLAINQGLMCLNSPGTVDHGYTGEIKVILFNTNNHPVNITKGMKVAQAVFCPVVNGKWLEPKEVSDINKKDRGSKGFGSTGI